LRNIVTRSRNGRRAVVVIEDDATLLATVVREVERAGYDAIPCADAEAAAQAVGSRGEPPLAVIADVKLGRGSDGIEAVRQIRDKVGRIPALIMTGAVSLETEEFDRLHRLGAGVDFERKPLASEKVRRFLERAPTQEALGLADAIDLATVVCDVAATAGLTSDEHQLLVLVLRGLNREEIAERVQRSEHTVKGWIHSLLTKTGHGDLHALRQAILSRAISRNG
jgi:FixJ family two-component response regulator